MLHDEVGDQPRVLRGFLPPFVATLCRERFLRLCCSSLLRVAENTNVCSLSCRAKLFPSRGSSSSGSSSSSLHSNQWEFQKRSTILTSIGARLGEGCYPFLRSALLRSYGLLRLGQEILIAVSVWTASRPIGHDRDQRTNGNTMESTSSRISHNLPGVATTISAPRSKIRRCFCTDMPPTIAATLTRGVRRSCCLTDAPGLSVQSVGTVSPLTGPRMILEKALRWSET